MGADKSVTGVILRLKWLYKLCGTAIRRPPIGMKYEVGEFDRITEAKLMRTDEVLCGI